MNIYDISKVAGVSIASVSRVINGAENVSEKTRKKVLDVIDQYGYTPNAYARGLGRGSMKTIGIMCSDPTDMYLASAINFLETELRSQGYNSILCCTGFELENKKASFELLKSRQVDAFVLVGSQFIEPNPEDNAYIIEGAREHPVMILNGYLEGENIYCTVCDEQGGMRNALHQLYDTGARKFVYVYSSVSYSGTQKLAGLRQGIEELGLPADALRTVHGHRRFDEMAKLATDACKERGGDSEGGLRKGSLRRHPRLLGHLRCRCRQVCASHGPSDPGGAPDRQLERLHPRSGLLSGADQCRRDAEGALPEDLSEPHDDPESGRG